MAKFFIQNFLRLRDESSGDEQSPNRETIEMLRRDTPDFIPPTLWPPDSPDLNPVDHKVWSVMQEQVYHTPIHDVNYLKQRLLDVWEE